MSRKAEAEQYTISECIIRNTYIFRMLFLLLCHFFINMDSFPFSRRFYPNKGQVTSAVKLSALRFFVKRQQISPVMYEVLPADNGM